MMGIRHKARETALRALYQIEMTKDSAEQSFEMLCQHHEADAKAIPYARELVLGVREKCADIDALIRRFAENWRLDRMSLVDRNVLRIAVFEFCYRPEVPARVILNEAIELAKRYGTEESGAFVNGILDAIHAHRATQAEGVKS